MQGGRLLVAARQVQRTWVYLNGLLNQMDGFCQTSNAKV
jgi:ATP-dependent 26S proteasome regulatory subunit